MLTRLTFHINDLNHETKITASKKIMNDKILKKLI